jgi:hypothetical protein
MTIHPTPDKSGSDHIIKTENEHLRKELQHIKRELNNLFNEVQVSQDDCDNEKWNKERHAADRLYCSGKVKAYDEVLDRLEGLIKEE